MAATRPVSNPKDASASGQEPFVVEAPPEEEFWDRYNRRLEFPLAAVATVFLHVVVGATLVYVLVGLMGDGDNSKPSMDLVTVSGLDDEGEGSAGSGRPDADRIQDVSPEKNAREVLPTPQALADAKENIQKTVLEDPTGQIPITPANAAAYSQLNEDLKKKMLGIGARKGTDNTAGTGPGGTGADATQRRGLRWTLRFNLTNGRDYIEQLRTMGAEILVPLPPDEKESLLFPDLGNTAQKRNPTDADFRRLAGRLKFGESRRDLTLSVAGALGLDVTPKTFWAIFPKDLEDTLARLETNFRNRRPEDIEETKFRVTVRGGKYEFVVDEQTAKK